jgi:uncharacterized RDD family membrane protein YckC
LVVKFVWITAAISNDNSRILSSTKNSVVDFSGGPTIKETSVLTDKAEITEQTIRCSLPRRLGAMIYDALIVTGLLFIAAAMASAVGSGEHQAFRDPVFTLFLIFVWFMYFALFWKYGGMTVGMRAWRVKIIPDSGDELSWRFCLVRFCFAFISVLALGIGMLWTIFERENRSWHDLASHSGLFVFPKP